jgi:dienelactone hydrolase
MRSRVSLPAARSALSLLAALILATPAAAQTPFGVLSCLPDLDPSVLFCPGDISTRIPSFDGTPIDLNVALPARVKPQNLPLIILSHGFGGRKFGVLGRPSFLGLAVINAIDPLASLGYVVLSISARGQGDSCGSQASRDAAPAACQNGYIRGDDARYELRDVQYLAGLLVDEGLVDPQRIGFTGFSYGGGVSLEAAALKDRIIDTDGTLEPWTSPKGVPMRVAAAVPVAGWNDEVYANTPNGQELDYTIVTPGTIANPGVNVTPPGVMKQSFLTYSYDLSLALFDPPAGANSQDDPTTWFNALNNGEPYEGNQDLENAAIEGITYQSAYYFDDSEPPAPMLIANGWTDDWFPVDEAVRFYNRTRQLYPETPIAMMLMDFGHGRGQNKLSDLTHLSTNIVNWFKYFVKDKRTTGSPTSAVQVLTETCPPPGTTRIVNSGGPFTASSWVALHPGELRFQSSTAETFTSAGGDLDVATGLDPVKGSGACFSPLLADEPNTANWRLPPATGAGYTLMGAPTVIFDISETGNFPEIAARLWDVAPQQGIIPLTPNTLVARVIYRPNSQGRQVFQLHPGAWHFAKGHVAKFQMLGQDSPYARASNGTFSITISNLDLRLPVHEKADCKQVMPPAAPFVPDGATLAPGVEPDGGKPCPSGDGNRR